MGPGNAPKRASHTILSPPSDAGTGESKDHSDIASHNSITYSPYVSESAEPRAPNSDLEYSER
ncbi:hypothetical protein NQ317_017919 [Molorchus minor]|uniref:Uncharacterized protein n=1 Tax=Molorchus minor TaxID=1323400 RepID=A0ABQ9J3V4_9CUCU|nr:hypothetical protein NQ317_017919 [Molorchus minor]